MRSHLDTTQKDRLDEEYALGRSTLNSQGYNHREGSTENGERSSGMELDVQVQVERSVTVDYNPGVYERESYRIPRRVWDSTPG